MDGTRLRRWVGRVRVRAPRPSTVLALVALAIALGRDAAVEDDMAAEKIEGIVALAWDLCGLT